ncbi:MAG TPA: carboxypeptidase regulatory-like domain-containing protein, partial [Planctomycetota bacterium]|nr:carboxypeptidase regulatory-like domain-containing protein [Planctomycetota bacterium]
GAFTLEATTDAAGRYLLAGSPPSRGAVVRATAPGRAQTFSDPFDVPVEGAVDRPDLLLEVGLLVRGRLLTDAGDPIAGGALRLDRASDPFSFDVSVFEGMFADKPPLAAAVSGADGAFECVAPANGSFVVQGSAPGRAPQTSKTFELRQDWDPPTVEVRLPAGRRIEGTVVADGGVPIRGAQVVVFNGAGGPAGPTARCALVRTDAAGKFQADGASPEGGMLLARADGYGASGRRLEPHETSVVVTFTRGATVKGLVYDRKDRSPIPDAVVFAFAMTEEGRVNWTRTGADGRYELQIAACDEGMLSVSKAGYAMKRGDGDDEAGWFGDAGIPLKNVVAGADIVKDVGLSGGAVASGRVVDDRDGAPIAGATVEALPNEGIFGRAKPAATATTGEDGAFQLTGLPEGAFTLRAKKDGWFDAASKADASASEVVDADDLASFEAPPGADRPRHEARADRPLADLVVRLARGADVAGVATGDDGRAAARAAIRWRLDGPRTPWMGDDAPHGAAGADGAGRFTLRGLPPRTVVVEATHPDYPAGAEIRFDAKAPPPDGLKLMLSKGGGIAGRILYPDGRPAAGVVLVARPKGQAKPDFVFDDGEAGGRATADAEGRYRFDHLRSGEVALSIAWETLSRWSEEAEAAKEPADAESRPRVIRLGVNGSEAVFYLARADATVNVETSKVVAHDVRLLAPGVVAGVVVDSEGAPVAGANVHSARDDGDRGPAAEPPDEIFFSPFDHASAVADERGVFRLAPVHPEHRYRLTAHRMGEPSTLTEAPDDGESPPVAPVPVPAGSVDATGGGDGARNDHWGSVGNVAPGAVGVRIVLGKS